MDVVLRENKSLGAVAIDWKSKLTQSKVVGAAIKLGVMPKEFQDLYLDSSESSTRMYADAYNKTASTFENYPTKSATKTSFLHTLTKTLPDFSAWSNPSTHITIRNYTERVGNFDAVSNITNAYTYGIVYIINNDMTEEERAEALKSIEIDDNIPQILMQPSAYIRPIPTAYEKPAYVDASALNFIDEPKLNIEGATTAATPSTSTSTTSANTTNNTSTTTNNTSAATTNFLSKSTSQLPTYILANGEIALQTRSNEQPAVTSPQWIPGLKNWQVVTGGVLAGSLLGLGIWAVMTDDKKKSKKRR